MADPIIAPETVELVGQLKEYENALVQRMSPEEKIQWYEKRAHSAEDLYAKVQLAQAASAVLQKYPLVEQEDLSEARTVAEMDKIAARIQAKAEKVAAAQETKIRDMFKDSIPAEDWERVKKAYGTPKTSDGEEGVDQQRRQEQGAALGIDKGKEEDVKFGDMRAVEQRALRGAGRAMEAMFGSNR